nr:unnamed protein product [Callosobruchus analis]
MSLGKNMPVLQETEFGWVIAGNMFLNFGCNVSLDCSSVSHSDNQLNDSVRKFWEIEEIVNKNKALSVDESLQHENIANPLAVEKIKWSFIPARSPTFGSIWEAGIKSVKHHIRRVIGNKALTFEEFATVLTQTEAVLNSRPLCPLSEDPDDVNALAPGPSFYHWKLWSKQYK